METRERSRRPNTRISPFTSRGVTLIELMVTLTVLSILVSVAVPSFLNILRDNQRTAILNGLLSDIQLARSAAIKSGVMHVICPAAASGATCGTSSDWTGGWIVFRDSPQGDTPYQRDDGDGVDAVVHAAGKVTGNFTVSFNFGSVGAANGVHALAFRPNGQVDSQNGTFAICDPRGALESRGISVISSGRAYIKDTSTNSNSNDKQLCSDPVTPG